MKKVVIIYPPDEQSACKRWLKRYLDEVEDLIVTYTPASYSLPKKLVESRNSKVYVILSPYDFLESIHCIMALSSTPAIVPIPRDGVGQKKDEQHSEFENNLPDTFYTEVLAGLACLVEALSKPEDEPDHLF